MAIKEFPLTIEQQTLINAFNEVGDNDREIVDMLVCKFNILFSDKMDELNKTINITAFLKSVGLNPKIMTKIILKRFSQSANK